MSEVVQIKDRWQGILREDTNIQKLKRRVINVDTCRWSTSGRTDPPYRYGARIDIYGDAGQLALEIVESLDALLIKLGLAISADADRNFGGAHFLPRRCDDNIIADVVYTSIRRRR